MIFVLYGSLNSVIQILIFQHVMKLTNLAVNISKLLMWLYLLRLEFLIQKEMMLMILYQLSIELRFEKGLLRSEIISFVMLVPILTIRIDEIKSGM